MKILVIDDDQGLRRSLSLILDEGGHGTSNIFQHLAGKHRLIHNHRQIAADFRVFRELTKYRHRRLLQGLQILSDLSSADIDLFTLPSAGELELPPDGALGWRLELGAERIAVQMSYDGTPLDLLGSQGGFAAVAALGIVAAVAIPAYQDYTVRARVQTAYSSVLEALERQHRTTGTLPGSGAQLELNPTADAIIAELHIARTGDIHLKLRGPDGIEGQLMQLRPILRNGQFSGLKCIGDDLLVKYQPPACR